MATTTRTVVRAAARTVLAHNPAPALPRRRVAKSLSERSAPTEPACTVASESRVAICKCRPHTVTLSHTPSPSPSHATPVTVCTRYFDARIALHLALDAASYDTGHVAIWRRGQLAHCVGTAIYLPYANPMAADTAVESLAGLLASDAFASSTNAS